VKSKLPSKLAKQIELEIGDPSTRFTWPTFLVQYFVFKKKTKIFLPKTNLLSDIYFSFMVDLECVCAVGLKIEKHGQAQFCIHFEQSLSL